MKMLEHMLNRIMSPSRHCPSGLCHIQGYVVFGIIPTCAYIALKMMSHSRIFSVYHLGLCRSRNYVIYYILGRFRYCATYGIQSYCSYVSFGITPFEMPSVYPFGDSCLTLKLNFISCLSIFFLPSCS